MGERSGFLVVRDKEGLTRGVVDRSFLGRGENEDGGCRLDAEIKESVHQVLANFM